MKPLYVVESARILPCSEDAFSLIDFRRAFPNCVYDMRHYGRIGRLKIDLIHEDGTVGGRMGSDDFYKIHYTNLSLKGGNK